MSEPAIEFGRATLADIPAVVELCMLVEEQHEGYWALRWGRRAGLREGYLGWLSRRLEEPRMLIYVAREVGVATPADDGPIGRSAFPGVVGMILVTIEKEVPIYTYAEFALVQDMAVLESHRRLGIAQKLLAEAVRWAGTHKLTQLRLMVANQNPTAKAAFAKAGFRETYQEMVLPVGQGP